LVTKFRSNNKIAAWLLCTMPLIGQK